MRGSVAARGRWQCEDFLAAAVRWRPQCGIVPPPQAFARWWPWGGRERVGKGPGRRYACCVDWRGVWGG